MTSAGHPEVDEWQSVPAEAPSPMFRLLSLALKDAIPSKAKSLREAVEDDRSIELVNGLRPSATGKFIEFGEHLPGTADAANNLTDIVALDISLGEGSWEFLVLTHAEQGSVAAALNRFPEEGESTARVEFVLSSQRPEALAAVLQQYVLADYNEQIESLNNAKAGVMDDLEALQHFRTSSSEPSQPTQQM